MKLLTYLSIFSMTLLSLQPIAQAKNPPGLTDRRSASRTALQRATRSIPPPLNTTGGLRVEYTLITANSPDCDPSLADNFPVRLQYRLIRPTQAAENSQMATEWMASPQSTPSLVPGEKLPHTVLVSLFQKNIIIIIIDVNTIHRL